MSDVMHATLSEMVAVTAAHTDNDAVIVARIKAVGATLKRGVTVKTLAADMAAEAVTNPDVTAVAQSTLGYAAATVELLESFGMSPASAFKTDRAAVVSIYRAIYRGKSKGNAFKVLKPAGKAGESDAERLAGMALASDEIKSPAVKSRAARPAAENGADETPAESFGDRARQVEITGKAIGGLISAISRDGFEIDPADAANLRRMMAELDRVMPRVAAPAPAPRKARAKVAA